MRRCTTLLLALALSATALLAQDTGRRKQLLSKNDTREFTERFLTALIKTRPFDAFGLLKAISPESETDIETTRESAERLIENVRPSYGKMVGYDILDTKSLGRSFIRYDYLLKFDRNALHCRFLYYNPSVDNGVENWLPVGLWFDANLGDLFDTLAK